MEETLSLDWAESADHPHANPSEVGDPEKRMQLDLRCGDCLEEMKGMEDESVDLVVTSPPYNLGIGYNSYQDDLPREEYLEWSVAWAKEVHRVMRSDASFFLNVGAAPADPLLPHQLLLALTPAVFVLQNTFHWIKSITVEPKGGEEVSAGHFKPINSKRFVNDCHEFVFHFTKDGHVPLDRRGIGVEYVHKSNISRWGHTAGEDKRCRGNNWFVPYETIQRRSKERPHPATFPIKLAEYGIGILGKAPGNIVMMDPFLGIGHAGEAALRRGVGRFVGMEIDPEYFEEAKTRLETSRDAL
ncbi:MAG: site-specific DNA-methyltransferase [Verrucomicrobiota bacterium]